MCVHVQVVVGKVVLGINTLGVFKYVLYSFGPTFDLPIHMCPNMSTCGSRYNVHVALGRLQKDFQNTHGKFLNLYLSKHGHIRKKNFSIAFTMGGFVDTLSNYTQFYGRYVTLSDYLNIVI
jgi:hypothetical protein